MHPGGDAVCCAFGAEIRAATHSLVINQRTLSDDETKCVDAPCAEWPVARVATVESNDTVIEINIGATNLGDLGRSCTGFAERNEPRSKREQEPSGAFVADPLHFGIGEKARWFSVTSLNGRSKQIDCWCDAEMIKFTQQ